VEVVNPTGFINIIRHFISRLYAPVWLIHEIRYSQSALFYPDSNLQSRRTSKEDTKCGIVNVWFVGNFFTRFLWSFYYPYFQRYSVYQQDWSQKEAWVIHCIV